MPVTPSPHDEAGGHRHSQSNTIKRMNTHVAERLGQRLYVTMALQYCYSQYGEVGLDGQQPGERAQHVSERLGRQHAAVHDDGEHEGAEVGRDGQQDAAAVLGQQPEVVGLLERLSRAAGAGGGGVRGEGRGGAKGQCDGGVGMLWAVLGVAGWSIGWVGI